MSELVKLKRRDRIAIITAENPPANALSAEVQRSLLKCIKAAINDPELEGVVLACTGSNFLAGADIAEPVKPVEAPEADELLAAIENSPKPIVAAIHGEALGGGLELALACHFRVATESASLGLPEIKLGIVPNSGGTQRLPRAVGPELAVKMIVGGEPIAAREALKSGLIDEIVESAEAGGDAYARKVLAERRPLRKLSNDDSRIVAARADRTAFSNAVASVTKRAGRLEAPFAGAEAVGFAIDLPFEEGLRKERETFRKLAGSDQSKALRHVFFAEREARNIVDIPASASPRAVERIAVIGAGKMGGGIAMSFANAGIPVTLIDVDAEQLKRGLGVMQKNWETSAARGSIPADAPAKRMALINGAVGIENVRESDLIIEAVFESMPLKLEVFSQLDKFAKPGAILASNTSYFDVNEMAKMTKRPQDVLGMHFNLPANVMKLCEVVRGAKTAPDALETAVSISWKIGKVPVVVGVCHGFVGNRMWDQRNNQVQKMLYEGALPQQVDGVMTKFGMAMGPFAMVDLSSLEGSWRMRQESGEKAPIEDALCEAGRWGQRWGKGYYKYEPGSRVPVPDPEVEKLIDETLTRLGCKRRSISDDEILERLIYPMINEGARILEEGIAARPGDIDLVWLYGFAWPIYRGGPMYWADQVGLAHIADRLAVYAKQTDDPSLEPAPLLKRLVAKGEGFASLPRHAKQAKFGGE